LNLKEVSKDDLIKYFDLQSRKSKIQTKPNVPHNFLIQKSK